MKKNRVYINVIRFITAIVYLSIMPAMRADPPQLPPNVSQYLESGWFGEDWMLKDTGGNLTEFVSYMKSNWSPVLDNIAVVAPTTRKKLLVVAACEALTPADYLLFLEKLVALSPTPGFDGKIWSSVIAPTKLKQGFLAYNYQNPRVAAVINHMSASLPANAPQRLEIQKITSGQARADFLEYNAAYNNGDLTDIALP